MGRARIYTLERNCIFMKVIPFYPCADLNEVKKIYMDVLGLSLYKDQGACLIFEVEDGHGIGFCTHMEALAKPSTLFITFVVDDVRAMELKLKDAGLECIRETGINERFNIEQALFRDPNGYTLEIQRFL